MLDSIVAHFCVLFTAQKRKKAKTWQDGTMKYYSFNKKLVLVDEKGYNIDRKFHNIGQPNEGDEIEFDGHLVTVESLTSTEIHNTAANQPPATNTGIHYPPPKNHPSTSQPVPPSPPTSSIPAPVRSNKFKSPSILPKKRLIKVDPEIEEEEEEEGFKEPIQPMQVDLKNTLTPTTDRPQNIPQINHNSSSNVSMPQKRVRVGLSKRVAATIPSLNMNSRDVTSNALRSNDVPVNNQNFSNNNATPVNTHSSFTTASKIKEAEKNNSPQEQQPSASNSESSSTTASKPFKCPVGSDGNNTSMTLQFPTSRKALAILKSKNYPKRSKIVPTKFKNMNTYQETFTKIICEHLEILLLNYGIYFYTVFEKYAKNKRGSDLERTLRSRGLGMYVECEFKGPHTSQGPPGNRFHIMIKSNREHHSKYNKNDIWVVSKVPTFEASQTFLTKSTFFGPFSDGTMEIECISSRDVRVAQKILQEKVEIYAIRTISASTEFMMLDTLESKLDQLPLLPFMLTNVEQKERKNSVLPPVKLPPFNTLRHIALTRGDNVDMESKMNATIEQYRLNLDQATVLRQVAKSVITCPGWSMETEHPIVLVHGVYGSGKSYLAAVIIIFLQELIDSVNEKREPEDAIYFKILVTSMTNVAVDRILQTLLGLGYDHFIRIGSMKKIAKNLLPYTSKARLSSNEELKELEQMLEDPLNSEQDIDNISTAIQKFRSTNSTTTVQSVQVVGTTFMSSTFEAFNGVQFPLVLVDEASQLMEPLTMVPLARFQSDRLVMIGDPLQLPPTLATNSEEGKIGKGLDKTLFDRMIEMGNESIMLRTQYRCHPRISNISNRLFYNQCLLNGVTSSDRAPLVTGLPTVLFIDVGGTEKKSSKSNSFWNDAEVGIAAQIIQSLLSIHVPATDLGVISLYKEQADKLSDFLSSSESDNNVKNVQISTVDAFQGGEKEIIVLSTVRTVESQFMENRPRINVALTRAKRHLIILGNKSLFSMNELWSKILWECQDCLNSNGLTSLLSNIKQE